MTLHHLREWPTPTNGARDLSEPPGRESAVPEGGGPVRLSEDDLLVAHSALVARPCACGSVVIADPRDPQYGIREHQAEGWHRDWAEGWLA